MEEEFKVLNEFPDYKIGSKGNIISYRRKVPTILKGKRDKDGYKEYQLRDKYGNKKHRRGHRLVGFAFLGLPPTKEHVINHKNGIKDDNRIENLEWMTISENTKHGYDVLNRVPSKHNSIKTALYTKDHELVKVFDSGVEVAKYLGVTIPNLCHNRKVNDKGLRHNRGCGLYLIHKKYYCKTYSGESVETIEKNTESA